MAISSQASALGYNFIGSQVHTGPAEVKNWTAISYWVSSSPSYFEICLPDSTNSPSGQNSGGGSGGIAGGSVNIDGPNIPSWMFAVMMNYAWTGSIPVPVVTHQFTY